MSSRNSTDFPELYSAAVNAPNYDIQFEFQNHSSSDPNDAIFKAALNKAAMFWELAITADVPDYTDNTNGFGTVDDILIGASYGLNTNAFPTGSDGVGHTIATGGISFNRPGVNMQPYVGFIRLDQADLNDPNLPAYLTHELGHALGLLFSYSGKVTHNGTTNTWNGINALNEYRILSNNPNATGVPLQSGSTADTGHWDEATFGTELMTPTYDSGAPVSRMTLAALRDLGYTVDLGAADPYWLASTTMAVRDDFSGNYNTTATLTLGTSANGKIELSEDNDWFKISLTAGRSYTFDMTGNFDTVLQLRAADGEVLARNDDFAGNTQHSRFDYTAGSSGVFYVDAAGFGPVTGAYNVSVSINDDFADSISDTLVPVGTVAVNGSATGNINFNRDVDYFKVTLNAGTLYRFDLKGSGSGNGTLSDPFLELHGPTDTFIASNDDGRDNASGNFDSQFYYTPTTTQNYYAVAAASGGNATGTYKLTVTQTVGGSVSIEDVTVSESNGTSTAFFTVTRTGGTAAFDISFATANGSATVADNDYIAKAGTLHFFEGVNAQTISVSIQGDFKPEAAETFSINLSGATNGATISDAQGIGTISNDDFQFMPITAQIHAFAPGPDGWSSNDRFPRELADVNGDGNADIVGFGGAGVYVSLATGNGSFGSIALKSHDFGSEPSAGGWASDDKFPRLLADINGDHIADIVGFGGAGAYVALGTASGTFGAIALGTHDFGTEPSAGGWINETKFPRELADVNGDGKADIVGFGGAGVYVALATGNGSFGAIKLASNDFGTEPSAGGWVNDDKFPRQLADVNGDGKADIVGFGGDGVYVALATSNGSFGAIKLASHDFGTEPGAGGWSSYDRFPRELADVNGDGKVDIVGFGGAGTYIAYGNGDGSFKPLVADVTEFGTSGGWSGQDRFPRHLADVNHDGNADIIGFGYDGVYQSLGFHLT